MLQNRPLTAATVIGALSYLAYKYWWSEEVAAMQRMVQVKPKLSLWLRGLRKLNRLASAVSHHLARRSALRDRKLCDAG